MVRTITDQVTNRLRELVIAGELAPEARIDQGELARQLGVSVVPVREALARLQAGGLVRLIPHRGAFVSALSLDEMLDIYRMREVLEEQAARDAAPQMHAPALAALDAALAACSVSAGGGDVAAFLAHTRTLHFTIYQATGRRLLLQTLHQLWDQSERYRRLQLRLAPERMTEAAFEDRAIVQACRRRDGESLAALVRYKVHQTTEGLRRWMQAPAD
ncbi:MAG: GntR family transcriptional regulator [Chloroflexi bacterium]|nr:GntR family transcriptional regulator [Chloroflexota bacterium]